MGIVIQIRFYSISEAAFMMLHPDDVNEFIRQHELGQWGEIPPAQQAANELALREGGRVWSVYVDGWKTRVCVVSEVSDSERTVMVCLEGESWIWERR